MVGLNVGSLKDLKSERAGNELYYFYFVIDFESMIEGLKVFVFGRVLLILFPLWTF